METDRLTARQYLSHLCCRDLQERTNGRNVQGIIVVKRGKRLGLAYKRGHNDQGVELKLCPFCGAKYPRGVWYA